jgi:hypothetical protein
MTLFDLNLGCKSCGELFWPEMTASKAASSFSEQTECLESCRQLSKPKVRQIGPEKPRLGHGNRPDPEDGVDVSGTSGLGRRSGPTFSTMPVPDSLLDRLVAVGILRSYEVCPEGV